LEVAFSLLAKNPSKKSNIIPKNTKDTAYINWPSTTKIVATEPDNRFKSVIKFGTKVFKSNYIYLVKIINYFCFTQV
jgi:hypothetical protein